jgi:hypothetical protein
MIAIEMSISPDACLQNRKEALKLLVERVGDSYYRDVSVRPGFAGILPPTWQDLVDDYKVNRLLNGHYYELTSSGWLEGLEISGRIDDPTFIDSLGRISQALKDRVKGRHQEALVGSDDLAKETGLPLGLIQSVIDSDILRYRFNEVPAQWASTGDDRILILIPTNVGLKFF